MKNIPCCLSEFLVFNNVIRKICGFQSCFQLRNFYSTKSKNNKYQHTVLLPKTKFPQRLEGNKRLDVEENIRKQDKFQSLYEWQLTQDRPEFILHDGPPYANGRPHIGHAINKILKDITLRSKVLEGHKVSYIPGWDCHGLPIELKALENNNNSTLSLKPLDIRRKARNFALQTIAEQSSVFQSWGLLGSWSAPYATFDINYICKQLMLFADLYEKGYIYQAYKPVYYSPSSQTALAEAELEYKLNHISLSAYVALPIYSIPDKLKVVLGRYQNLPVYAAVWTTTPWTLVGNAAICLSSDEDYCFVKLKIRDHYSILIWAEKLLSKLDEIFHEKEIVDKFKGLELHNAMYQHPLKPVKCPIVYAKHVNMVMGTGLVHTAPAHGHEDFLVSKEHNLPVDCYVDKNGNYTADAGIHLEGKSVLEEGNECILHLLESSDNGSLVTLLKKEPYTHSYPYDWRTKKPVIIRASEQWFFDTDKIRAQALDVLSKIEVYPPNMSTGFLSQLERRPYWCISRQRSWGVPLPAFYDSETHSPVMNREIIENVANKIKEFGCDCWWSFSEKHLLPLQLVQKYQEAKKELPYKGLDILDIWFDSGSSWFAVLDEKQADMYLEGVDQFTGWFQSSLLTSVAAYGRAPYKKLFVHGFALDDKGQKMSKSLGNVVDPQVIVNGGLNTKTDPIYGADVLRYVIASHVTNHGNVNIGKNLFDSANDAVQKIRITIRFLLSSLSEYNHLEHNLPPADLRPVDQYMLYLFYDFLLKAWQDYDKLNYHRVASLILNFITKDASAFYFSVIKDRLYCDSKFSSKRISCLVVLHNLLHYLLITLAPVLPHLVEEAALYHPTHRNFCVFHHTVADIPSEWDQAEIKEVMKKCLDVRNYFYSQFPSINTRAKDISVFASGPMYDSLRILQSTDESTESGLCELMQVSRVNLFELMDETKDEFRLEVFDAKGRKCQRCWKLTAEPQNDLCFRCSEVLNSYW